VLGVQEKRYLKISPSWNYIT